MRLLMYWYVNLWMKLKNNAENYILYQFHGLQYIRKRTGAAIHVCTFIEAKHLDNEDSECDDDYCSDSTDYSKYMFNNNVLNLEDGPETKLFKSFYKALPL